ncbi:hypothetical protein VTO42DRAFT_6738 [Malbranchea cinnamomea]
MSSITQGSDNDAYKDELELDNSDGEQGDLSAANGHPDQRDGDAVVFNVNPIADDVTLDRGGQSQAETSELDLPPEDAHPSPTPLQSNIKELEVSDDAGSIPDDSPSVQGSVLSSKSSTLGLRGSPSNLSVGSHRPFDLRFQSRLSASLPSGQRSVSPSLIYGHSRNSSFASHIRSETPDLQESPPVPWEVVRWTNLRKITGQVYSEIGKRNFGRPTCLAVSTTIAIGTSKGVILVFDYQQNLKAIIGFNTKAVESGPVTALAISADHSTLAAGHADGNIFTWEIGRPNRPFLHILPIPASELASRKSDGHVFGTAVIHVGFLGTRRTALVSADDHGMAFSHLATRGMGAVARIVRTTRILGRYLDRAHPPKPSSVLAFSPLPLGNVPQSTDSMGLVAMITPYLLVIVSTTPVARTQHKSGRPKEVAAHSAMTAALAWFPAIKLKGKNSETSKTKLVYCWSNVLTILDVSEVKSIDASDADRPPRLDFKPRSRWRAEEAIVAVQWISRSVLAVMTITQQLIILEDRTLRVTDSFDLLHKHIYHVDFFSKQLHSLVEQLDEEDESMHGVVADAFFMSFRVYKGRIFLLGFNDVSVGSLSNWADRLLALMEAGDFIAAISLATAYYKGDTEKVTVGLPEEDSLRHELVQEKLLEMMLASLKYALGKLREAQDGQIQQSELRKLADVCISACDAMGDDDFLFDEVYAWYEDYGMENIFLDALEPYINQGSVRTLPPPAVKALITHFATNHTVGHLEEIICLLDTTTMDIEQVTSLCKEHNLYDAYIYVWNRTLHDYIGPLRDLIGFIVLSSGTGANVNGDVDLVARNQANATKIFPYLSYVLTGRIYPTGDEMDERESSEAKTAIYRFLFSGSASKPSEAGGGTFKDLRTILEFDTASFMSMLNEAFEDSYLNEGGEASKPGVSNDDIQPGLSINRQYLISILLQIMDPSSQFSSADTIYLDMFIARNLPKYPQYILLSGSILQQVLVRLCSYTNPEQADDCQLSAEYLLSTYRPPDIQSLIPLFKEARFFRILKSVYRAEMQYPDLLLTYLEDPEDRETVFDFIHECLRPRSSLSKKQRRDVHAVIQDHAAELAEIDVTKAARTVQALVPELHATFLDALASDSSLQYRYLNALFGSDLKTRPEAREPNHHLVERYVSLMCQYDPSCVPDFVDGLNAGDLRLEYVLPSIENSGIVDAAVILLGRQGEARGAMDRLTTHLGTLEAGLNGLLENVDESPDSNSAVEAVDDLVASLTKYTRVGIWLCQEQTKAARRGRGMVNFPRRVSSPFDQPPTFDEKLWLSLIDAVVRISQNVTSRLQRISSTAGDMNRNGKAAVVLHDLEQVSASLRTLVHQVFTALLTTTSKLDSQVPNGKADASFLRVLRAFLSRAAAASPSLSELRTVIGSIFSAYTYEASLLSLANSMLDKDLFVHVDEVAKLRQRGWRPRGQVCEVCRRRAWGPGSGSHIWAAWEKKQAEAAQRRHEERSELSQMASRGKGKALALRAEGPGTITTTPASLSEEDGSKDLGPIIVFGCRHIYHVRCLEAERERQAQQGQQPTMYHHSLSSSSHHHHDGGHGEFYCLVCTVVQHYR